MTNGQKTLKFFAKIDAKTKNSILTNIAKHYKISPTLALQEVGDDEAEHLLDYVTGPERAATIVLMQKYAG